LGFVHNTDRTLKISCTFRPDFPKEKERIATRGTRTDGFAVEEAVAEAAMEISEFQGAVESAA
jgi:hypothetical protein